MAREFIVDALNFETSGHRRVFESPESCRSALEALEPNPDHMFWFEYNFLYVLAAGGAAEKSALGRSFSGRLSTAFPLLLNQ